MSSQAASPEGSRHGGTLLATMLSIVAVALAAFALYRTVVQTRRDQREEFREAIVNLQREMMAASQGQSVRASAAQSWVYYAAARKLAEEIPDDVNGVDYFILASFALGHGDVETANDYLSKAQRVMEKDTSAVRRALGLMALGHLHFDHAPKTDPERARGFYKDALAQLASAPEKDRPFTAAGIHLEWALDEFASGDEEKGNAQLAELEKLLADESLPEPYRRKLKAQADASVIEAKVQGGLL